VAAAAVVLPHRDLVAPIVVLVMVVSIALVAIDWLDIGEETAEGNLEAVWTDSLERKLVAGR